MKNARLVRAAVSACLMLHLTACSGIKTQLDDPATLASGNYRKYAWTEPPLTGQPGESLPHIVDQQLRAVADELLVSKDYQEVSAADAAVLLRFSYYTSLVADEGGVISPRDEQDKARHAGEQPRPSALYNHPVPPVLTYDNLQIEFVSPDAGRVIWQGKASLAREYGQPMGEELRTVVTNMTTKILSGVPSQR